MTIFPLTPTLVFFRVYWFAVNSTAFEESVNLIKTFATPMDDLYMAICLFRARKHEACIVRCERILRSNPDHKGAWVLLLQCEVEAAWVDEWSADEECTLADALISQTETHSTSARPGTTFRMRPVETAPRVGTRPTSIGGRPMSGVVRPTPPPLTAASLRTALRTPASASISSRRAITPASRPPPSASGGTCAALGASRGPWLACRTLHEAAQPGLAKPLFEYILLREGNVQKAMELATEASKACLYGDIGWWEEQIGRCQAMCGRLRDARITIRTSMGLPPGGDRQTDAQIERLRSHGHEPRMRTLSGVLRLSRIDARLDQPLAAISVCLAALDRFPGDVVLLTEIARLYEALGDEEMSVKYYRDVLRNDPVNTEALACVATYHFYQEQPDMALPFYRHLMQMGVCTVEVLCNLSLCYLGIQQLDLVLPYFFKALSLAEISGDHEILGLLWYNASHIALSIGDINLAIKCLNLCLSSDPNNSPAYNNLAILELISSDSAERPISLSEAKTVMGGHLKMAHSLAPSDFEPAYNMALLLEKTGDIYTSFTFAKKALQAQPNHTECKCLLERLRKMLTI